MMRYLVIITLYVQILLCVSSTARNTHTVKSILPDAGKLKKFLVQILRPNASTYRSNKNSTLISRSHNESSIEKAIENKIKELKPFLQDKDDIHDSENKLTLEGNDETTIVEYVPTSRMGNNTENDNTLNKFKENIKNYKKMRRKIEKLLDKETVPEDTKIMVTKTIDKMIAQLIDNQCTWKRVKLDEELIPSRQPKIAPFRELGSKEWLEVKKHYTNLIENINIRESYLTFLQQSFDFFSKIAKNFNVQCRVIDEDGPVDFRHNTNREHTCANFKICTNELRKFLTRFYKSLNDSAVSTFRNYAEMYSRDVNTDDGYEKNLVINTIKNISYLIEHKVSKIFKKELVKLKLDTKKNEEANIKALRDFVTDNVNHVRKFVKKHLKRDLKSLRAKKISIIKEDLTVNLNMDLDNLEKKYIGKICKIFAVCNNHYIIDVKNARKALDISDSKNVYVKVQLTLGDKLKDSLASKVSETKLKNKRRKYDQHFIVTRTTKDYAATQSNPPQSHIEITKTYSIWQNLLDTINNHIQ